MDELIYVFTRYVDLTVTFFALLGSIVIFHRKAVAPTLRKVEALSDIVTEQMRENGGGNLIDKVNKIPLIEEKILIIERKLERVEL